MQKVIFLPSGSVAYGEKGKTILDIAFENDIVIEHNCGGLCSCTSCRVLIKKGIEFLSAETPEEREILSGEGFSGSDSRLSCRCEIIIESGGEILVEIPNTETEK
jgi:ferredoxin, 2Fe-2S